MRGGTYHHVEQPDRSATDGASGDGARTPTRTFAQRAGTLARPQQRSNMHVEWYGQSAFRLSGAEQSVVIDPFGDMSALAAGRGMQFDYPPIDGVAADLLLVTHEHADHNGVEAIGGEPRVLRSTAGRLDSPLGEVTAVASEHDAQAGTERGPNTIFVFDARRAARVPLRRLRTDAAPRGAGRGDRRRRPADRPRRRWTRRSAPSRPPRSSSACRPRWVVPMHYRTPRDQLPRAGRRVPRALRARRASGAAGVRHGLAPGAGRPAGGRARGAVARDGRERTRV